MADLEWSDCGKQSKAQFFYGNRKGRRQVGLCGRYETRTALYARRLEKRWVSLFKKKHNRPPSEEEMWAALRTGQIAEDVRIWEKTDLTGKDPEPTKSNIHRARDGRRMTKVLGEYLKDEKAREQAKIKQQEEEDAAFEARWAESQRIVAIRKSSEVPREMLARVASNRSLAEPMAAIHGITVERLDELLEAWGFSA